MCPRAYMALATKTKTSVLGLGLDNEILGRNVNFLTGLTTIY